MTTAIPSLLASLQALAAKLGAPIRLPSAARAVPHEQLIVRYSKGTARFSDDRKHLILKGDSYLLNGDRDGECEGVYELLVPLSSIGKAPPPAEPPFNRPEGPVPQPAPQAYSKGIWRFADASSLTATGPALLHRAQFITLATDLWISANQIITEGSGQFAGAQGLKTAGVSIFIPPDTSLEKVQEVPVKTIDVFRIIRREHIGKPPPLPP